jgi:outer membrane protein, heavy metal efflux system
MKSPQLAGLALLVLVVPVTAGEITPGPADAIIESIDDGELRDLLAEVLERNPGIAEIEARMAAAGSRTTAVRKLPDPTAEVTAFVLPPETRVGPQRFAARLNQRLPGGGKRGISEKAADFERQAIAADIQVLRLQLISEARRLVAELWYLDEAGRVIARDHTTLEHYEELARARYASGVGLQMDAIQLQAEMSRLEARQTEFDERRAGVVAEINHLRDRPGTPVDFRPPVALPTGKLDWDRLHELALVSRPELRVDMARIERAGALIDLAGKDRSPDFSVGLTYAYVDRRTDVDVPNNGQDVLGISGGITIPLWKTGNDAQVEAATQMQLAEEASRRTTITGIQRQLEDLRGRIPEIQRRLALLEDVLPIQSEQALASAESAYAAGRVDALALLDAERLLLDVRLSAARSRTDLAMAFIDLEAAVAAPVFNADGGWS